MKSFMSKKSMQAKVEFILEMIDNIDEIIKRHHGIVKTLEDFEGQMAVLMGLSQIGETLKKLDDKDGAYYTRNYIVHDYEGEDWGFIENILRVYLPELQEKLLKLLSMTDIKLLGGDANDS